MQSDERKAPGWAAAVVILLMAVLSHWLLQRAGPAQIEALPPGSPLAALSPLAAPAPGLASAPVATQMPQPTATLSPCLIDAIFCITPPPGTPFSLTPKPYIPPTPLPADTVIGDPDGIFHMTAPQGWFVQWPPTQSVTDPYRSVDLASSDVAIGGRPPLDTIMVYLGIAPLDPGRTIEQGIAERREEELHPRVGWGVLALSDVEPITLAGYPGLTYKARIGSDRPELGEIEVQEIWLDPGTGWVIAAHIKPVSSPHYQQAIAMLQSLTVNLTPAIATAAAMPAQIPITPLPVATPATVPLPTLTPDLSATPLPVDTVFSDPAGTFTMTAPKGWFAYLPLPPHSIATWSALFTSANARTGISMPPDSAVVHLSMAPLPPDKTFDQWVTEHMTQELNPPVKVGDLSISGVQPITIASFSGTTYTFKQGNLPEQVTQYIHLNGDNRWIINIDVGPNWSPQYPQAMSMLQTLELHLPPSE